MAEGRRARVREKIKNAGIYALSPHEVIEFLLYPFVPRKDTVPIGRELIKRHKNLKNVFELSGNQLKEISGMPEKAALFLPNFSNICKRSLELRLSDIRWDCSAQKEKNLENLRPEFKEEEIRVVYLDINYKMIHCRSFYGENMFICDYFTRILSSSVLCHSKNIIIIYYSPYEIDLVSDEELDFLEILREKYHDINIRLLDFIKISSSGQVYSVNDK